MREFTEKQDCLDWLLSNYNDSAEAIFNHKRNWVFKTGIEFIGHDIFDAFKNKHTDLDSKQQLEQRVVDEFHNKINERAACERIAENIGRYLNENERLTASSGVFKPSDFVKFDAVEIKETIIERSAKYGEFEVNSKVMQGMKKLAKTGSSWDKMSSYQKEAVEMILHKIGRIVCGDSDYIDSWHDIAGYAKLVEDILDSAKRAIELNDGEVG